MRPPLHPGARELALLALLAAGCTGDLHPIRASSRRDAAMTMTDGGLTDMSMPSDAIPSVCPDNPPVGYATMSDQGGEWDGGATGAPALVLGGGVTGGGASTPVVIDASDAEALAQFVMYAGDKMPGPLTIEVRGMIAIPPPPDGGSVDVQKLRLSSNKTVAGADARSGFTGGGLVLTGVSNVILRNLVVEAPNVDATGNVDAIHIEGSTQIWIDHCDLASNGPSADAGASYDGLVDISDGSDFVTVSWTRYRNHPDTGLVGRSDSAAAAAEDAGKDHVTYDHDLFSNVKTGPRIRFGTVHVLNTLFEDVANYAVAATDGATVKIENSAFTNVTPATPASANFGPVTTILDSPATAGSVDLVGNSKSGINGPDVVTQTASFTLPYPYSADLTRSVPALATQCTGTGVVPPLPPTN